MNRQTIVYTDSYAPPEQRLGKAEPRSDLYALAATLFHLATGVEPVPLGQRHQLDAILSDPRTPAQHRWFYELLKINLSEDANDRYFSAQEFKADLDRRRVSKETQCPRCQATNEVRRPYCSHCAEPLTDSQSACAECGRDVSMGSRFCIHCGNRLR
ncbi:MAG: zinc ribbon domain-containing protein [Gemmataceae bacterium]|nr:zinc ribbon domain-containing protein [Gemmataceae bacterium]